MIAIDDGLRVKHLNQPKDDKNIRGFINLRWDHEVGSFGIVGPCGSHTTEKIVFWLSANRICSSYKAKKKEADACKWMKFLIDFEVGLYPIELYYQEEIIL